MKGLSFYISIGSYAGFRIDYGYPTLLRIVLGWIAFTVIMVDLDELIGGLTNSYCNTISYIKKETGELTASLKEIDPDSRDGELDHACHLTAIETLKRIRGLLCIPYPSKVKWKSSHEPIAKTPGSA